ncbi:hypothetical protein M9Y10_009924 [Tritrichomonas musculus]|uniref:Sm domain-containing protein n=1 Tax=Tritrichomonas musculus TaxID=1915356 RepID=A0ABR2IQV1_9EUKA
MSEETTETQSYEYDQTILHQPKDPQGPVLEVSKLVQEKVNLKLELKDNRTVIGTFAAFDKLGNFVLSTATELFRDEKREVNMIIIPLDYVTKVYSKPAEPQKEENESSK